MEEKAARLFKARQRMKDKISRLEKKRLQQEAASFKKVKRSSAYTKTRLESEFLRALGLDEEERHGI